MDYERIKQLIERHSDIVDFFDFGEGSSEECIKKAELEIGYSFPKSYKWWLKHYGGGSIGGEEIFSVYPPDAEACSGGDVVQMFKGRDCKALRMPICYSDIDGGFSLDLLSCSAGGECTVYSQALQGTYADNFIDFLEKRIRIFSE